jgi:cyclopropane fatty-acyl-phospholipid synthase-like methyltransferase
MKDTELRDAPKPVERMWDRVFKRNLEAAALKGTDINEELIAEWPGGKMWTEKFIAPYIPEGGTAIEIGAGSGRISQWVVPLASTVYLTDYSNYACSLLRDKFPTAQVIEITDCHLNGIPDAEADLVYSVSVFGHLYEEQVLVFMQEAFRKLRPGGMISLHLIDLRKDLDHFLKHTPEKVDSQRTPFRYLHPDYAVAFAGHTGFVNARIEWTATTRAYFLLAQKPQGEGLAAARGAVPKASSGAHLVSPERFSAAVNAAGLRNPVRARMNHDLTLTEFETLAAVTLESEEAWQKMYRIPFPFLVGTGIGYASDHVDKAYTLKAGLENSITIDRYWKRHRADRESYRVLDFGCGTGRLLRYACEFGAGIEVIGCEVNPKAVSWLQSTFPCEIRAIETAYDLSFITEPLDLIYAWSIFTHFQEEEHLRWLAALTGKLRPGGLLIATFKSTAQIQRMERDQAYRVQSLAADRDLETLKREAEGGFAFFECYDEAKSSDHGIDAQTFGQAYVSHEYIRARWSEFGEVLEIGPAVTGWQDLAVLRRKATE